MADCSDEEWRVNGRVNAERRHPSVAEHEDDVLKTFKIFKILMIINYLMMANYVDKPLEVYQHLYHPQIAGKLI